ncbi:hypothetical protein CB1_000471023 [Camelus ferus]|nr:hypothetical protein CB1_000471023 [Camelus ferus]
MKGLQNNDRGLAQTAGETLRRGGGEVLLWLWTGIAPSYGLSSALTIHRGGCDESTARGRDPGAQGRCGQGAGLEGKGGEDGSVQSMSSAAPLPARVPDLDGK